jgi:hypothetical protein
VYLEGLYDEELPQRAAAAAMVAALFRDASNVQVRRCVTHTHTLRVCVCVCAPVWVHVLMSRLGGPCSFV